MTDQQREISESLKRIAKATEEIARLMRQSGDSASKAALSFGEIVSQANKVGIWPPYDH